MRISPVEHRETEITARAGDLPPFDPHPWLRGGHAQTLAGRYWPTPRQGLASTAHEMALADGDRLVLLESPPPGWEPTRPTATCWSTGWRAAPSLPYMIRLGARLVDMGIRVVRVNPARGGAGFRAGPGHLPRGPERRPQGGRQLARESGRPLADRCGRILARRQPGPEAGGGVGRRSGRAGYWSRRARLRRGGQSAD